MILEVIIIDNYKFCWFVGLDVDGMVVVCN